MPTQSVVTLRPFVGGLNTEINGTVDTTNNTSDELNCTIFNDGIRGRRYGMDTEKYGTYFTTAQANTYSCYLWKNVNKTDVDFVVYQVGEKLHFYKYNNKPISINKLAATIDLTPYIIDLPNFEETELSYAIVDGKLVVANKYMKPIKVVFDDSAQSFNVEEIRILYRDFEGVEDGLRIDEEPLELSDNHHYNLINQGWQETEINKVKTDHGFYPANNMQWFMGKDNSGTFNTDTMLQTFFGNTRAPKGHCILDFFERDRSAASGIYSSLGAISQSYSYFSQYPSGHVEWAYETRITDFTIEIPNSFGTANSFKVQFNACSYYFDNRPQESARCTLYGLNGNGEWIYIDRDTFIFTGSGSNTKVIQNPTQYERYKIEVHLSVGVSQINAVAAVNMQGNTTLFPYTGPNSRVTDITSMSGKVFYLAGDTVLFTQTITDDVQNLGYCYQDADPTSEHISDLVPTDGGHVKFNAMGEGLALTTFNRGVLVFGRERVYGLLSPRDKMFSATEYDQVELSSAGLSGRKSIVSVSDSVYYWSPLGIFRIGVNTYTGSTLVAESITNATIQQYYNSLSAYSKEHCKGVFDFATNRIYWYYPLTEGEPWKLNGVLVYDLNFNAFMPYKISDGGAVVGVFTGMTAERIRPAYSLFAGDQKVVAGDANVTAREIEEKYDRFQALQHAIVDTEGNISFGDYNSRDFIDWGTTPYDSYMISAPITFDDLYYNKQAPILQTVLQRTEEDYTTIHNRYIGETGAYLRIRWHWGNDMLSNRWDLIQDCYKPQKDFLWTDYISSRIHIRGRGKALQVEIRNDENKDFRLAALNLLVRI